jgi:hypothetical protein
LWEYTAGQSVEIYGVDIFDNLEVEEQCKDNLNGTGIKVMKERSVDAAEYFTDGYFDFVYIDADHSYESVLTDIRAWLPKVRDGGMIAGHDYVESQPGVKKAVHECFGTLKDTDGIDGNRNLSWYKYKNTSTKPDNNVSHFTDSEGNVYSYGQWVGRINKEEEYHA